MAPRDSASILTDAQRRWLEGESEPAKVRNMRSNVYKRLRAAIGKDARLVARALEDGTLDSEEVAKDFGYKELGDGIRDLVAALYVIGHQVQTFDAEKAIEAGLQRGKQGRLTVLRQKLEDDPSSLTIGEWHELRESPEHGDRADSQIKQEIGRVDWFGIPDELADAPDDE